MANSDTQQTSSHSVAELAAELQNLKRAKIWWWQKDDILKARMSTTIMAGILFFIVLSLYVALLLTRHLTVREIHIVVIMFVMVVGFFFGHAIFRLMTAVLRPHYASRSESPSELDIENHAATTVNVTFFRGPGGYAIPAVPIPIAFPDIDKAPTETTSLPPPAYGLWRSSVRVNPDQFYWVRRDSDTSPVDPTSTEPEPGTPPPPASAIAVSIAPVPAAYRPPSYSSDDGVEYVLGGPRLAGTVVLASTGFAESESHQNERAELDTGAYINPPSGSTDGEEQTIRTSRERSPASIRRLA